jgi:hypothetical protein
LPSTFLDPRRPLLAAYPTFDPSLVWVLCWSKRQGMLHIETLGDMLEKHSRALAEDLELQYIPVLIGDRSIVDVAAERLRPMVTGRFIASQGSDFIPY